MAGRRRGGTHPGRGVGVAGWNDDSWRGDAFLAASHAQAWPYTEEVTAGFVDVRLHGPDALYARGYSDDQLRSWAQRLSRWQIADQPAARTITDRAPPARRERDVYVYFNNDKSGHAPRNAARLRTLLTDASDGDPDR